MSSIEVLAEGVDHPEAVIWDAEREVVFCGGEEGQLYAVGLDGSVAEVTRTGGSLLGLALDADGLVYACDAGARAVMIIDPDTGLVVELSTGVEGRRMVEPNGIALDAAGNLYVTDSGRWGASDGAVFRIGPDGRSELWSAAAPRFPNGCMVRDGCLVIVESGMPGLVEVPMLSDGSAGVPRELRKLPDCVPDQVIADAEGGLLVGCYRPDLILRIAAGGSLCTLACDPSGMTLAAPTGCTFAGRQLELLVVANHGARSLVTMPGDVPGAPVLRPVRRQELPRSQRVDVRTIPK